MAGVFEPFPKIEGFWGCWKKWLPSSGPYNLEEYLYAYLWFHQKKIEGEDPFWCLVNLVANNNSVDVLKEALKAKPDMLGVNEDEANLGMIDDGLNDDDDDDDNDDDKNNNNSDDDNKSDNNNNTNNDDE